MIQLQNLDFSYRKGRKIFDNLSIEIERGAICGLLGKNGVGKTTLLHLIAGLLRAENPEQISVMNFSPFNRSVDFLSRIFLVPEEFSLPRTTIEAFAKTYGKFYPRFSWKLFSDILTEFEVNISEKLHTMSFGQRKKAYIAFAIACNTDILLLDEPTNGLDIPSKIAFRRIVARIMDDSRTIIISTHQVRDLEEMLDSIIILENDGVLLSATVSEITSRLRFEVLGDTTDAIYSQSSLQGTVGVTENHKGDETRLDIELLFGATVTAKEKIHQIFSKR